MNDLRRSGIYLIKAFIVICTVSQAHADPLDINTRPADTNSTAKVTVTASSDQYNITQATNVVRDSTGRLIHSTRTNDVINSSKAKVTTPRNCGHKGGYDCMKELPENSFALLEHLEQLQQHPNFKYLEFDIRETKDKKLVVFHDKYIASMLPDKGYNKQAYKDLRFQLQSSTSIFNLNPSSHWKVSDLSLRQLQTLSLEGRARDPSQPTLFQVPTLEEYLNRLKGRLTKPIVFDIKDTKSQSGTDALRLAISGYAKQLGGNRSSNTRYNSFPYQQVSAINLTGLKNSLDDAEKFCGQLKLEGIHIYRSYTHDSLCDEVYESDVSPKKPHLKNRISRAIKRIGVKHHIREEESRLDPENYYKPRLVHLEPASLNKPRRFIYTPITRSEHALKQLHAINKDKLIIFVHGRGQHPKKGEPMIVELAERHNAAVVMFDWDSWICTAYCMETIKGYSSKHPYGNATAAAPHLAKFLGSVYEFKKANSDLEISLLVHSMGNIVFKQMIDKWETDEYPGAFIENLILNSADVDRDKHNLWLEKVKISQEVFVTMTRRDIILGAVELLLYKPRLGQGYGADVPVNQISLEKHTHYLDFSDASSSHRKFGARDSVLRRFFVSALGKDSWAKCPTGKLNNMKKDFDYACVTTP